MRVAYLGPEGTYSDEALRAYAPAGAVGLPCTGVHEAVMAVQRGEAERAIVPMENSIEGGVSATLDALAGEADQVRIAGEVVRPIQHCVIAGERLGLDEVERVLSHPQPLGQCARFLRERMPRAQLIAAGSTAAAVRSLREGATDAGGALPTEAVPTAALGSRFAAELYGCEVLAENVADEPGNVTRFVWLAPADEVPAPDEPAKTSIVFWGAGDETPGWLVAVLGELADRGVNLSRIESRPRRVRLGHYMFFADLAGAAEREPVAGALEALRARVEVLRVLGSYPAAA